MLTLTGTRRTLPVGVAYVLGACRTAASATKSSISGWPKITDTFSSFNNNQIVSGMAMRRKEVIQTRCHPELHNTCNEIKIEQSIMIFTLTVYWLFSSIPDTYRISSINRPGLFVFWRGLDPWSLIWAWSIIWAWSTIFSLAHRWKWWI